VSDIEESLKLYEDILGLEIVFDKEVPIGGKGLPTGIYDTNSRLVFLKSHLDHKVGVIGLLQFLDKPLVPPAEPKRKLGIGDCVILLNTTEVEARMASIKRLPDVFVQSEGSIDVYPAATGGTLTVKGNSLFDRDGNFIELNEVLAGSR
jgi:catechol 2,3-dioxygenase-like lactoylglutathione lyase family enzyme